MNRLNLLKSQKSVAVPEVEYTDVFIPFNLKDVCKQKYGRNIRWNMDTTSWSVIDKLVPEFEKIYLEEFVKPTKEDKLLLKNNGANYDKETQMYYLLKFQTEEVV